MNQVSALSCNCRSYARTRSGSPTTDDPGSQLRLVECAAARSGHRALASWPVASSRTLPRAPSASDGARTRASDDDLDASFGSVQRRIEHSGTDLVAVLLPRQRCRAMPVASAGRDDRAAASSARARIRSSNRAAARHVDKPPLDGSGATCTFGPRREHVGTVLADLALVDDPGQATGSGRREQRLQ